MTGLVLFDYDGTLVDERDEIYTPTHLTKKAIQALQDKGYLCVLATGRAQSYIPKGARDLHLDGYVTSNGACVTIHGKEIFHDVFSDTELMKLISYMEEQDVNYVLENTHHCFVKDMQDSHYTHFIQNFNTPKDNFIPYTTFQQVRGKTEKITLVFKNRDILNSYARILGESYVISYHRNCNTFDIAKPIINKGVGVKKVMDYFDIDFAKTYAFGDGDNDVELLGSVNCGIAMRIHDDKLDAVAKVCTGTVKEEGIYNALKEMEVI